MPKVIIDGIEYETKPGRNMLEVALDQGLDLPYFCWHPAMGSVGACRLCAVRAYKDEHDTKGKVMMACMTQANEGTRISINDPEAMEFRRYVIEWLMTNHPHDCPVCDEGGECHLQDMTAMCNHVYRRFRFRKRTYESQYIGPFVTHEMNRCIQCYRCVRFYRDLAGGRDLNVFASKNRVYFGRDKDGVLQSEFSGNLVEVCPTGVFTDKTLARHYTRKWDLETAPSICIHCGLGCNTIPGARYNLLRRIRARFNGDVNGYFLCDRGRYGYEFVNDPKRLREPLVRTAGGFSKALWSRAISQVNDVICKAKGVVGIGSPRASLESNFALKRLIGGANYSTGLSAFDHENAKLALSILKDGPARTPSLAEVELADVVLILGADPTNEAPMLDFAIRQAMHKAPLDIARKLKIPDWDANAVANALQNAKGKLHIITPWPIKLEEIGDQISHLSFADAVTFAEHVQMQISSGSTAGQDMVLRIAADLAEAHQPLIVTSISAGPEVIKAAANIAWALKAQGKDCWISFCVPEANTIGVAMLGGMSVDDALERVDSGMADTLLVMENDLVRRISPAKLTHMMKKVKNLIVLDCIETSVTEHAHIVLPVSAYIESDGTFINNECRAQRFYQVFIPKGEMKASWSAIKDISGGLEWETYESVLCDLVAEFPDFAPALAASQSPKWRDEANQKVARMPHRYSGRTAKDANETIMEPQTPDDPQTPFSFSMEGDQNPPAPSLIPRFWWPGWNSNNSINKFQIEVGGPLHGGNPGKRILEPTGKRTDLFQAKDKQPILHYSPYRFGSGNVHEAEMQSRIMQGKERSEVWVIPRFRIFGSEELSRFSPGIAELTPPTEVTMHPKLAESMGASEGEEVELEIGGQVRKLPVRLDELMAVDVMSVPANFNETLGITSPGKPDIGSG